MICCFAERIAFSCMKLNRKLMVEPSVGKNHGDETELSLWVGNLLGMEFSLGLKKNGPVLLTHLSMFDIKGNTKQ